MTSIHEVLAIESIDRDIYRGGVFASQLPRTFGGQVAAQSLKAALQTVEDVRQVHSLHGYFLRPGNPQAPTVYLVDRLRDGRSFTTRIVKAIQDGENIFSMSVSFQVPGDIGLEHQDQMPEVPGPEEIDPIPADTDHPELRFLYKEWPEWDIRPIPRERMHTSPRLAAQQRLWFRSREQFPADQNVHACALAYMSDMTLLGSARSAHPGVKTMEASLDHSLWFLRELRVDEWMLYDQASSSAGGGRALTHGRIFNVRGEMIAVVAQEGLARILAEK